MTVLSLRKEIRSRAPTLAILPYWLLRDRKDALAFLLDNKSRVSRWTRLRVLKRLYTVTHHVECHHSETEVLSFIRAMHSIPDEVQGCIVEAGSFKGGSTAKFSIAVKMARRELVVFDSFEGIPENAEVNPSNLWGGEVTFSRGAYYGSLEEVKDNVSRFGEIGVCRLVKGFFETTMPHFKEPVVAAYLDVDLASSTRTCLKYLWPLLVPGGYLFSQDGHLPLVLEVFNDDRFWNEDLESAKPRIHGFGSQQLIWMQKSEN